MYVVTYAGGSHAFPVKGLDDALKSPHPHTRERAATLLQQSLTAAQKHATRLRKEGHEDVLVLRAGRQSDAKGWRRRRFSKQATRVNNAGELQTHDEAWTLPTGYVDPEADKHGTPVVATPPPLSPLRSNEEKALWYTTEYKPNPRTCLWM